MKRVVLVFIFMPIFSFSAPKNDENWMDHHMRNEHKIESYDLGKYDTGNVLRDLL